MKKLILLCTLAFVGCSSSEELPPTDSEIIQARTYVADYDRRMEKASQELLKCTDKITDSFINSCRATVYDIYGFNYTNYSELSSSELSNYKYYKLISYRPLTSELKGCVQQ